jgi:hypothetical protein
LVNLKNANESAGFHGGIKDHMDKNLLPNIDNTIEHRSDDSNGEDLKETKNALLSHVENQPTSIIWPSHGAQEIPDIKGRRSEAEAINSDDEEILFKNS